MANLRENPQVAIICLDPATRSGCRISGKPEIFDARALFDQLSKEYSERKMTDNHVVKIAVEDSYTFKLWEGCCRRETLRLTVSPRVGASGTGAGVSRRLRQLAGYCAALEAAELM